MHIWTLPCPCDDAPLRHLSRCRAYSVAPAWSAHSTDVWLQRHAIALSFALRRDLWDQTANQQVTRTCRCTHAHCNAEDTRSIDPSQACGNQPTCLRGHRSGYCRVAACWRHAYDVLVAYSSFASWLSWLLRFDAWNLGWTHDRVRTATKCRCYGDGRSRWSFSAVDLTTHCDCDVCAFSHRLAILRFRQNALCCCETFLKCLLSYRWRQTTGSLETPLISSHIFRKWLLETDRFFHVIWRWLWTAQCCDVTLGLRESLRNASTPCCQRVTNWRRTSHFCTIAHDALEQRNLKKVEKIILFSGNFCSVSWFSDYFSSKDLFRIYARLLSFVVVVVLCLFLVCF